MLFEPILTFEYHYVMDIAASSHISAYTINRKNIYALANGDPQKNGFHHVSPSDVLTPIPLALCLTNHSLT